MFDIHFTSHEHYRCRPSNQPEKQMMNIPVWMFDSIQCSEMTLVQEPFCSLDSLKQLLLLLDASPVECIIDKKQNTFTKKGDANGTLLSAVQPIGLTTVSKDGSLSRNPGESFKTTIDTTDDAHEQNANRISKNSERRQ